MKPLTDHTNRELDAMIAERVMGKKRCPTCQGYHLVNAGHHNAMGYFQPTAIRDHLAEAEAVICELNWAKYVSELKKLLDIRTPFIPNAGAVLIRLADPRVCCIAMLEAVES
jgi:hypothetical protein